MRLLSSRIPTAPALAALCAGLLHVAPASACTPESYIANICTTAAFFCPRGTLDADGRLLPIAQYTPLFALIGTAYGGDGQTTFAVPDLRGRTMIGQGQGPGLPPYTEGQRGGAETVTLTVGQLPAHSHSATARVPATASNGNTDSPAGAAPARLPRANNYSTGNAEASLAGVSVAVANTGGNQPVQVRDPYLTLRHCIVIDGIFPSRP